MSSFVSHAMVFPNFTMGVILYGVMILA